MNMISWLTPVLVAPLFAPPAPTSVLSVPALTSIRAVAVSADGGMVAAAGGDRTVRLWDVASGKERPSIKLSSPISQIAFAPDSGHLASLSNCFELWNVQTGRRDTVLSEAHANQMAYALTGRLALAGHRVSLRHAGNLKRAIEAAEGAGWLNTCVAFSVDETLVAAGDAGGNVCVWDTATGKLRMSRTGHKGRVVGVGFIDDGRTVVSGGRDGRMKFWDVTKGRQIGVVFAHDNGRSIGALACAPDGRTIATGGADDGEVRLWEAATGQQRAKLATSVAPVTSLAIALRGATLAVGQKGQFSAWRLYPARPMLAMPSLPKLWQDLSGDSPTAYRAILTLTAHPSAAAQLLGARLHPVKLTAAVRKECAALIASLDSDDFDARERANSKLEAMSPWIEPYLQQALPSAKTLELQRRLRAIVAHVGQSTLPLVRAVEVLEHAPGAEARQLLRQLADGEPSARVTREARQALARCDRLEHP